MEFPVSKQLLTFILRFQCPSCEFSTFEARPIQKHLLQCSQQDKHLEDEFKLDIKDEFVESDLPCKVPMQKIKMDPDKVIDQIIEPQIEAVLCGEP